MFKKILAYILLLLSICFITFGVKEVYEKQNIKINYYSFQNLDDTQFLYIKKAPLLLKNSDFTKFINQEKLPAEIQEGYNFLEENQLCNWDEQLGENVFIYFNENDYTIILKQKNISIHVLKKVFEEYLMVSFQFSTSEVTIDNKTSLFYFEKKEYLCLSTKPINFINETDEFKLDDFGNYDLAFHDGEKINQYKFTSDFKIKTNIDTNQNILGKKVDFTNYYSLIPEKYDVLNFYGSSRFLEDATELMSTKEIQFFDWVDQGLIYLKKDSFDVFIEKQNDVKNIKNLLYEETLKYSKDSILPPSIFFLNYEIFPLINKLNWSEIFPLSNTSFNFYAIINDYVVFSSSIFGLKWYLNQIHVGNIVQPNYLSKLIPSHLNYLSHDVKNDFWEVKTKVSGKKMLHSFVYPFEKNIVSEDLEIGNFNFYEPIENIELLNRKNQPTILINDKNKMYLYDSKGNILWEKTFQSPLIKNPVIIDIGNDKKYEIAIFSEKSFEILNENGEILSGFPKNFKDKIIDGTIVDYESNNNYRIFIQQENAIFNFNTKGEKTEGWNSPIIKQNFKKGIRYENVSNKDYIVIFGLNDSIYLSNRKGEIILRSIILKNKKHSEFLIGNENLNSLKYLYYENNKIYSFYLASQTIDSTELTLDKNYEKIEWLNNEKLLLVEYYNRIELYNEFGLKENEVSKPNQYDAFLPQNEIDDVYIFGNMKKNDLYLLNKFGSKINQSPLKYSGDLFVLKNDCLITFWNTKIYVYKLK